jgi:hypothetical protein
MGSVRDKTLAKMGRLVQYGKPEVRRIEDFSSFSHVHHHHPHSMLLLLLPLQRNTQCAITDERTGFKLRTT